MIEWLVVGDLDCKTKICNFRPARCALQIAKISVCIDQPVTRDLCWSRVLLLILDELAYELVILNANQDVFGFKVCSLTLASSHPYE
jgi:hypothetical protein